MYPTGAIAHHQCLYLTHGDMVVITLDGMFQAGSRHGKFQRILVAEPVEQTINQSCAEGIAATDPVHDMDSVIAGKIIFTVFKEHGGPIVV